MLNIAADISMRSSGSISADAQPYEGLHDQEESRNRVDVWKTKANGNKDIKNACVLSMLYIEQAPAVCRMRG